MNSDLEQIARSQLGPNEKLLWFGQPRAGLKLRAADALLIPFSLMWGGFAIVWEVGVLRSSAPPLFVLWGIPFVLIGLYLIVGRFFVDAWQRSRTYYALTSERAIIVSGLIGQQVKSLPLGTMSDITLTERRDGSGSIALASGSGAYAGWPSKSTYRPPTFEMIENVREVHTLLRNAQTSAARGPSKGT